jgi:UDP-2,3-diacylglucosamine hydrolase
MSPTTFPGASQKPDGSPVGIVAGRGQLPFTVAAAARDQGRRVVLFALRGFADPGEVAAYPHHWLRLGQFGRLCRLARREGCRDLVLIGGVQRPRLWQLRLDWATLRLYGRIKRLFRGGDDRLLSGIADAFEERGFRIIGAHEIAPEILMTKGPLGRRNPTAEERADIAQGLAFLRSTGGFDVGQAVVVADRRVLAVEAAEGTDWMLWRVAELRADRRIPKTGGVLVKAPKPGQDRRIDLPAIGLGTIAAAAEARLSGIAVVAGSAIVAQRTRLSAAADRAKVFLVGVDEAAN